MNTFLVVIILTFLNTLIALLGFPFPYWFDRWFIVISGIVILSVLLSRAFKKQNPHSALPHEETPHS